MEIQVQRYQRNKVLGNSESAQLYYLKFVPGKSRTHTDESIAKSMERIGSLSIDDVLHCNRAMTREIRTLLAQGDKVHIQGLGTFFLSFNCTGTEEEKDCTVRNIHKVNVRFKPDNTFRLVNDSTVATRGAEGCVKFAIKGETTTGSSGGGNDDGGDDSGGGWIDPTA
ncbi:DNA-binding protein [Bacteroides sp. 519]|uniref:HU family DNA-binding protein n=1 Tax=Bacteroides sp. 519 TaxID=2302937 RepID=UPI0013D35168|nr:DNA-binding protein [Bacteroides sp. 519]NDV58945.1 DNA-binding protein [Bacteroides sp. 519]